MNSKPVKWIDRYTKGKPVEFRFNKNWYKGKVALVDTDQLAVFVLQDGVETARPFTHRVVAPEAIRPHQAKKEAKKKEAEKKEAEKKEVSDGED